MCIVSTVSSVRAEGNLGDRGGNKKKENKIKISTVKELCRPVNPSYFLLLVPDFYPHSNEVFPVLHNGVYTK